MKELLAFFYVVAAAIVSFIVLMRLLVRLASKRHERHLRETKAHLEYLSIRDPIDESLMEEWDRLQVYAQWLRDRISRRPVDSGRHVKIVSDEEIRELISDCNELLTSVVRAQCLEHHVIKGLPSNDGMIISRSDHDQWHWIQHGAARIKREFTVLLMNRYRYTTH